MLYWFTTSCFIINIYVAYAQLVNDSSTTTVTTTPSNITEAVPDVTDYNEDIEKKLKDYDWDLWCKLQPNTHDCSGRGKLLSRFYYDTKLEDCKTFSYGGCNSAYNNFETITQCHDTCSDPGLRPAKENFSNEIICRLQPDFGNCFEYHPMFYYDVAIKKCRGFSYSGCGGNGNRFPNAQTCTAVCLHLMEATFS